MFEALFVDFILGQLNHTIMLSCQIRSSKLVIVWKQAMWSNLLPFSISKFTAEFCFIQISVTYVDIIFFWKQAMWYIYVEIFESCMRMFLLDLFLAPDSKHCDGISGAGYWAFVSRYR